MIEQKAMAYVNMYGVLGSLESLCKIDEKAREILKGLKKPVTLCFSVKGGPCCSFAFSQNGCVFSEGDAGGLKMSFSSPEKFNALINESKPGLPVRNPVGTLAFLAGTFTKLTDRLNEVLRPAAGAMDNRAFFEENTLMTMYVLAGAIAALANTDSISRQSAAATPDGDVSLGIKDTASVTLRVKNHHFTALRAPSENPRAVMEFADIDLAAGLFAGKVATVNELCRGNIRLAGMLSMVDNINRILDRAAVYLS